jgi:hypothetical protein
MILINNAAIPEEPILNYASTLYGISLLSDPLDIGWLIMGSRHPDFSSIMSPQKLAIYDTYCHRVSNRLVKNCHNKKTKRKTKARNDIFR